MNYKEAVEFVKADGPSMVSMELITRVIDDERREKARELLIAMLAGMFILGYVHKEK